MNYAIDTARGEVYNAPTFAKIAQLVEHRTENAGVPGSSPGLGKQKPISYEVGFLRFRILVLYPQITSQRHAA